MAGKKVPLPGSGRSPAGTRVGDVPEDEIMEVSVILKPKTPMVEPQTGGAAIAREEFAARYGADPGDIDQVKAFAKAVSYTHLDVYKRQHQDLAVRSHARPRPPRERFGRDRFGQSHKLSGNVAPLPVVSLPKSFQRILLRVQGHCGENHSQQ